MSETRSGFLAEPKRTLWTVAFGHEHPQDLVGRSSAANRTHILGGTLGGTRTPNLLIRRSPSAVHAAGNRTVSYPRASIPVHCRRQGMAPNSAPTNGTRTYSACPPRPHPFSRSAIGADIEWKLNMGLTLSHLRRAAAASKILGAPKIRPRLRPVTSTPPARGRAFKPMQTNATIDSDHARSKRSLLMTLSQAATKSPTNFSSPSELP